ncbi:hypothetical protein BJV82DRAFT_615654 [Fennellomyces sp. T-0311]|nr:hypothetical protein BJV82DRAFT_615654 [Fennellomyces sp. T-0311]
MYITYDQDQWRVVNNAGKVRQEEESLFESLYRRLKLHALYEFVYGRQVAPSFMPTWLIRVSDMQLVRGSAVRAPYYTLSYSPDQSGDYSKNKDNDKYTLNDQGKHEIISYQERKHPRGKNATRVPKEPRLVKFEELVQQICKDFGVTYIWWDERCIEYSNPKEAEQIHRIYSSSYCTLILVPELDFTRNMQAANMEKMTHSQWVQQVWMTPLDEAYLSKRLLFVGRNVHAFSHLPADYRSYGGTSHQILLRNISPHQKKLLFFY